jgi:hypothetical protein
MAILYGIIAWALFVLFEVLMSSLTFGLTQGIMVGLLGGMIGEVARIEPVESLKVSLLKLAKKEILRSLIIGLIIGLVSGLIGGLSFGLLLWSYDYDPQFVLLTNLLIFGVTLMLKPALILGGIFGLVLGIISSTVQEIKIRSRSNQGVWNSLQSQIFTTIFISLLMIFVFKAMSWFLSYAILISFSLGFSFGGGKACLQHLSLRIVLWQSGLPWNFARFLNYCVERRLLLRVGGSYRFLHRELLDHFAQSSR